MAGPWEKYGSSLPQVIEGDPKQPSPQTPAQAEGDVLGNVGKRVSIEDTGFDNRKTLRDQFDTLPEVKSFSTAVSSLGSALRAADDPQGDLQIIYDFAKTMDPGSVVREGEMQMADSTASLVDRLRQQYGMIADGKRLPPSVRTGLIEAMRNKVESLNQSYAQRYRQYSEIAQRNGVDPREIVGDHLGDAVRPLEEAYIRSHGGTPRSQNGQPIPSGPAGPGDIGFNTPNEPANPLSSEQQSAYDLFLRANPNATAEQLRAFGASIGADINNAEAIVDARNKGAGVQPGSTAILQPRESIQERADRVLDNSNTVAGAFGRGAADTLSIGLFDEANAAGAAIGDMISGEQGGFGQLYNENRAALSQADSQIQSDHPIAFTGGQVAGGLALPNFGASTARQLAGVGAGYGGVYGFNSGEGFTNRALNALGGTVAGAATGYAIPKAFELGKQGAAAAGRRFAGDITDEQRALLQAADEERVPVNMSDVFPQTRNTVATLETIPGASGPVREGIEAGRDAIEARVGELGRGGTARTKDNQLGDMVQTAGRKFVKDANKQASRLYTAAERAAGDTPIMPDNARRVIADLVAQEEAVPGGTRAGAVIRQYADAFADAGTITIAGARSMRSELLSRLRTDGGLSKGRATRLTGQIMDGINQDIETSLRAAGRGHAVDAYKAADKFYRESREEIERFTEKFIGTDTKPKSAEQTIAALNNAMKPKGGDVKALTGMFARLSPEERADYAATLVANLGRKSADEPFSPADFITNVRQISPQARRIVFGAEGERSIDNLIRLSQAKKETVGRLNNSRSGQVSNYRTVLSSVLFGLPGGGALIGLGQAANVGAGATGAATGAALAGTGLAMSRGIAKVLMNEEFTRLLAQAPATSSPAAINRHVGRMRALAAKDPNVRSVVEAIERDLIRAANDNLGRTGQAVASPNEGPDQQQ